MFSINVNSSRVPITVDEGQPKINGAENLSLLDVSIAATITKYSSLQDKIALYIGERLGMRLRGGWVRDILK